MDLEGKRQESGDKTPSYHGSLRRRMNFFKRGEMRVCFLGEKTDSTLFFNRDLNFGGIYMINVDNNR